MNIDSVKEGWWGALFSPGAKTPLSHIENYFESTEGVQASFELVARCFEVLKLASAPLSDLAIIAERAQAACDGVADAVSLPRVVTDPYSLAGHLFSCIEPSSYAQEPFSRRIKNTIVSGLLTVRSIAKSVLLANTVQVCRLAGPALFKFSLAATVSTLIADSSDLIRDCWVLTQEVHNWESALLALINVVKNVASVIIGGILTYVLWVGATPLSAFVVLGLGFVFSAARISSYFVEKMLVSPSEHSSSPVLAT
ncbi:MAG: hypothetical protein RLZZ453_1119 [Chlamydiota bacterium]